MSEILLKKENIEKQLSEIELISSIYANTNEFVIEDPQALLEAKSLLETNKLPKRNIGYIIKFNVDITENNTEPQKNIDSYDNEPNYFQLPIEMICRLSINYPTQAPEVFVRCSCKKLNRKFSEELSNYINSLHENESDCSILSIIEWIKEKIAKFLNYDNTPNTTFSKIDQKNQKLIFTRYFIYVHHIYSVEKRRNIIDWARELELGGFCMPGKPGIIICEGNQAIVEEYWRKLRSLNWHKIQIREHQNFEINNEEDVLQLKKFSPFEERVFQTNSDLMPTENADLKIRNEYGSDMGLLFKFLSEKGFSSVFNLYFGVDGKLPTK